MSDLCRPRGLSPVGVRLVSPHIAPTDAEMRAAAETMAAVADRAAAADEAMRELYVKWLLSDRRGHAHYARHAGTPRRRNRPGRRKGRR